MAQGLGAFGVGRTLKSPGVRSSEESETAADGKEGKETERELYACTAEWYKLDFGKSLKSLAKVSVHYDSSA